MCYIVVNVALPWDRGVTYSWNMWKTLGALSERHLRKYESAGYTSLAYPQGWSLGPLLLVLTVYTLSSLLRCNFFPSNRLVCRGPARQAGCSLSCIHSRPWVPCPACFLMLKMSWQPDKQACQCGDLGEVSWTIWGLSLKFTFEKKPSLAT